MVRRRPRRLDRRRRRGRRRPWGRPRRRARARRPRRPRRPDYCFFVVHVSKTGRPVNKNLNAINANARNATEMSMIAVMALRNGLSRKP